MFLSHINYLKIIDVKSFIAEDLLLLMYKTVLSAQVYCYDSSVHFILFCSIPGLLVDVSR